MPYLNPKSDAARANKRRTNAAKDDLEIMEKAMRYVRNGGA